MIDGAAINTADSCPRFSQGGNRRSESELPRMASGPLAHEDRQEALDNSRGVRLGQDPRGRGVPTFAEAAARTINLHRNAWKAGSPLPEQWESTFRLHVAPLLDKPVDRISSAIMVPAADCSSASELVDAVRIGGVTWGLLDRLRLGEILGDVAAYLDIVPLVQRVVIE